MANASFDNLSQMLEVSLLVDHGLETANPFDPNHISWCPILHGRLDHTRPRVVFFNLLGARASSVRSVLNSTFSKIVDYVQGTRSILVLNDSVTRLIQRGVHLKERSLPTSRMLQPMSSWIHPGENSKSLCWRVFLQSWLSILLLKHLTEANRGLVSLRSS